MNGKRWFTTAFCLPAVMVVLIGAASATLHQECDSHFFGGKSKKEKERLKKIAAELWLQGELSESKLRKVLSHEEIQDLSFGKQWIEDVLHDVRR